MAGVYACCPSSLVSLVSALVLLLCFIDAEVSNCPRQGVLYKNVGEDVELSCFQGGDVFEIRWTYNSATVAVFDGHQPSYSGLFQDRLDLNPTTFSLTVKNLKLTDSGQFSFVLTVPGDPPQQLPTASFNLQVVEVLTATVTSNSTWNALNASCTVVLECSSGASGGLWYRWSVRDRTTTGPRLTYIIGEEDGDTVFTCTVRNSVSEASVSKVLTCSNRTEKDKKTEDTKDTDAPLELVLGVVITVCVVTVAAGTTLCVCRRRCQRAPIPPPDQTVYADVSPVPPQNEHQPCSLYDSIDYREKPAPQSVYDKIQLRYMREPEISARTPT